MNVYIFGGTSSVSCSNYAPRRAATDNKDQYNLGIIWQIEEDTLGFQWQLPKKPLAR